MEMIKDIKNDTKEIKEDISDIKITQTEQAADIEHHIRRCDMLEQIVENNKEETKKQIQMLYKKVNISLWDKFLVFCKQVMVPTGLVLAILKIFSII
jgi:hypothetical protein